MLFTGQLWAWSKISPNSWVLRLLMFFFLSKTLTLCLCCHEIVADFCVGAVLGCLILIAAFGARRWQRPAGEHGPTGGSILSLAWLHFGDSQLQKPCWGFC